MSSNETPIKKMSWFTLILGVSNIKGHSIHMQVDNLYIGVQMSTILNKWHVISRSFQIYCASVQNPITWLRIHQIKMSKTNQTSAKSLQVQIANSILLSHLNYYLNCSDLNMWLEWRIFLFILIIGIYEKYAF